MPGLVRLRDGLEHSHPRDEGVSAPSHAQGESSVIRKFHHVGLKTVEKQAGESWVESTRVWVSNPAHHPQSIEWLRYEPDSPIGQEFQNAPHIAYTVDDLGQALIGKDVVIAPFEVGDPPFATAAFTKEEGVFIEYMQLKEGRAWFDDDLTS